MNIGIFIVNFENENHIPGFISKINENFIKNIDKKFFVITDKEISTSNDQTEIIKVENINYYGGLIPKKYELINQHLNKVKGQFDYVFYMDYRIRVIKEIGKEILQESIGVIHPGYSEKNNKEFEYERNPESSAFIENDSGYSYFFDTIFGGTEAKFSEYIDYLYSMQIQDEKKGIVSRWGDESYLNRLFFEEPPKTRLSPEYSDNEESINSKILFNIETSDKINLRDMTFTIPIKVDSMDRRRNIELIVDYLLHNFDTNIIIGEESESPVMGHLSEKVQYIHYKQQQAFFYRTRLLNLMAKEATTPFISNYDCDIFLNVNNYVRGVEMLRKDEYDIVYPFRGINILLPRGYHDQIYSTKDTAKMNINESYGDQTDVGVGCVVFQNREKFIEAGMENENFKSWGPEDQERYERYKILGYRIGRLTDAFCYHLDHVRGADSGVTNPYFSNNNAEFDKVRIMDKYRLQEYIKTWNWVK